MRDAHKRLEAIYKATAPEQKEADAAEASLDEFTRCKKKVHQEMKQIRQVRWGRLDVTASNSDILLCIYYRLYGREKRPTNMEELLQKPLKLPIVFE